MPFVVPSSRYTGRWGAASWNRFIRSVSQKSSIAGTYPIYAQEELSLTYMGDVLVQKYKPDFICFEKIIVELKAVKAVVPDHEAQLMNYLKATGMKLGFLVNFGSHPEAEIKRRVL